MGAIAGYHGNVLFDQHYTANVHAWTADIVMEALEDTAWQRATGVVNPDLPWRTYITGLAAFVGTFECYLDDTIHPPLPGVCVAGVTIFQLRLYVDYPTSYYEGMAMAVGVHPSAPIEGMQAVTIDFQGSMRLINCWGPTTTPTPTPTPTPTLGE